MKWIRRWNSPIGTYDVTMGELGVSRVEPAGEVDIEFLDGETATGFNLHVEGEPASMRLDLQGLAPFKQVTLAKLLEIPFGEARSYAWVAREIGRPAAVRAVASAIARNPVPVLIPCHRVIRSDGTLGEYSLVGPQLKRDILAFEGLDIEWIESLTKRGVRFLADTNDNTFHIRTCSLVPKHPTAGGYLELKSSEAAEKKLLKPCRRCRPVHVY